MQLKEIPIASIIVGDRFRKDYGDMAPFIANIREKGLIQPITVDQHNHLLAGGRRLQAHIELGLPTILAIIREISGELDALEIELFENTERKDLLWFEQRANELAIYRLKKKQNDNWTFRDHAKERGISLETAHRRISMGATLEQLPELAQYETEKDAQNALHHAVKHGLTRRVLETAPRLPDSLLTRAEADYRTGDTFKGMAAEPSVSFNFAEVDPPYGIDLNARKSRNQNKSLNDTYKEVSSNEYPEWFSQLALEVYRLLKPNSFAVFWYGITHHHVVLTSLRQAGFSVSDIPGVWYKTNTPGQTASPSTMMGNCYETFFVARKGMPEMVQPGRKNMFEFDVVPAGDKEHATEKPIELYIEIIKTFVQPASKVLIPFLGSGAMLRAIYAMVPEQKITGLGWDRSPAHKNMFLGKVLKDEQLPLGRHRRQS